MNQINDGIGLINRWSPRGESVYALVYVNPFSYALRRKPAPGGSAWLHPVCNFSDAHKPSPERLFGQAGIIMVPKCDQCYRTKYILRNYSPYLERNFHQIAESKYWRLYRNNQRW